MVERKFKGGLAKSCSKGGGEGGGGRLEKSGKFWRIKIPLLYRYYTLERRGKSFLLKDKESPSS